VLQGGLVFKAHRLLYHATLGLRVIKKTKKVLRGREVFAHEEEPGDLHFSCWVLPLPLPSDEGTTRKFFRDFYPNVKTRIWPRLSCMCHIRWTADVSNTHPPVTNTIVPLATALLVHPPLFDPKSSRRALRGLFHQLGGLIKFTIP